MVNSGALRGIGGCADTQQVEVVGFIDNGDGSRHRERLADGGVGRYLRAAAGGNGLIPTAIADEAPKPEARLPDERISDIDSTVAESSIGGTCCFRVGDGKWREVLISQVAAADASGTDEALNKKAPWSISTSIDLSRVRGQLVIREPGDQERGRCIAVVVVTDPAGAVPIPAA